MELASEPVISSGYFPMPHLILLEFLSWWAAEGDTYRAPRERGGRTDKVMMTMDDLFLCR